MKSSISSQVRKWKIRHSCPGCSFVWVLRGCIFQLNTRVYIIKGEYRGIQKKENRRIREKKQESTGKHSRTQGNTGVHGRIQENIGEHRRIQDKTVESFALLNRAKSVSVYGRILTEVCTHDRGQDSPIQTDLARLIRCLLHGENKLEQFLN